MTRQFKHPAEVMEHACHLARQGAGSVEPNPMVGAVLVDDNLTLIAEGFHARFGGPHAEIVALDHAGQQARGSTLFVTLEPCCHFGKTPPCTDALIRAGIRRVVVAQTDPFPEVAGKGIEKLRQAGIEVEVGLLEETVHRLNAPFRKLVETGLPYVHAKWAMSLDGKIASSTGRSQWISNEKSRARVHQLRGRMDAILVGIGTALADDPLLTARPAGPRVATRIVLDSQARLPLQSQLVRTVADGPVLVVVGESAPVENIDRLRQAGVEVLQLPAVASKASDLHISLTPLLQELGRRRMTNVFIEGGSQIHGAFLDAGLIDELHVFIAPGVLGGAHAKSPIAGAGLPDPATMPRIDRPEVELIDGGDVYVHGPLVYEA